MTKLENWKILASHADTLPLKWTLVSSRQQVLSSKKLGNSSNSLLSRTLTILLFFKIVHLIISRSKSLYEN